MRHRKMGDDVVYATVTFCGWVLAKHLMQPTANDLSFKKMVKNIFLFVYIVILGLETSYAFEVSSTSCAHSLRVSLPFHLPVVAQTTGFTCGVACLDSLLRYWKGHSPGEIPLALGLGTSPVTGTSSRSIQLAANYTGLYAREQFGATLSDIRRYLLNGETVYVGWASENTGHYSLIQSINSTHITLMDPWYARTYPGQYNVVAISEFVAAWLMASECLVKSFALA